MLSDIKAPASSPLNLDTTFTDWKEDLDEISRLYNDAERLSDDEIQDIIIKFLAHVPNHVAAAKKLVGLGPIEDVFKVGVLEEDE